MNELYEKYKDRPLKEGHKWMMVGLWASDDDLTARVVISTHFNGAIAVMSDSMLDYYNGNTYETTSWKYGKEMPKPKFTMPMSFEMAVQHLWELQQKGPVLIKLYGCELGKSIKTTFTQMEYKNWTILYSTDLGETWNKFEKEVEGE